MLRKPNLKTLIVLFNNIEKAMAREDWNKITKNCKVFISLVETYKKQVNSLNKERR